MKKLSTLIIFVFIFLFSFTIFAYQMRFLRGEKALNFSVKIHKAVLDPLPAGTYTIGSGGYFPTIDSAFNKLSVDGIAGSVNFVLIDTLYTAPTTSNGFLLNGPIPGADEHNQVWICPAENKNVTIEGNGGCVLTFLNTSYLTLGYYTGRSRKPIQNENLKNNTRFVIHSKYNSLFKHNDCVNFINNSDHNVVQNITFIDEDNARGSVDICFSALNSSPFECPDSNLIYNNFIKKAAWGIYMEGSYGTPRGTGNIVRGNFIGSETDSLIGWGIQLFYCRNTLVENNIIQNLKLTTNLGSSGDVINVGINSYWGDGDTFRNNVIHNIKSNAGYTSTGIMLSGSSGESGSNNLIYNNMVYDIQSSSNQTDSRVSGIQMWYQNNPQIYYNSIYLSGKGTNKAGSASLYFQYDCNNAKVMNNILINTRDESQYCAAAIYYQSSANLISNNNSLFYNDQNANNCLVRRQGTDYKSLSAWQQALNQDKKSINEMPNFVSSDDLHINGAISTNLESHGVPISEIDFDFDGEFRDTIAPDIGADEFRGTVLGVNDEDNLPVAFALEQNYPNPFNPTTKIKYTIPAGESYGYPLVQLKVFDVLGREVAALVNETKQPGEYEIKFNAKSLSSGVYFYQLKVGEFIQTKKMILLK